MAEIQPIKGWRYNPELSENIDKLVSPLFDIIARSQVKELYEIPLNSVHLSVPLEDKDYFIARDTLEEWKNTGILLQDKTPSIYVYYQYFSDPQTNKQFCRKGFIINTRLYDWNENIILRHENTIPGSVTDRIKLLKSTELNTTPTHGLYSDTEFILEKYMDESIKTPVYDLIDYQGVRNVMSIISDEKIVNEFIKVIQDKKIIIADGHHRYESSLEYLKEKMTGENYNPYAQYNFHMMLLTNMEMSELKVFPTHRTVSNVDNFVQSKFLKKLSEYFIIEKLKSQCDINNKLADHKWSFGLITHDHSYLLVLKPEVISQIDWDLPPEVKELDLTVMHFFIIEKILGITKDEQRTSQKINFKIDFTRCYTNVMKGEAQVALITKAISMEEIKRVCFSGYLLPQKSTYFYPKVLSGLIFSSIKNNQE